MLNNDTVIGLLSEIKDQIKSKFYVEMTNFSFTTTEEDKSFFLNAFFRNREISIKFCIDKESIRISAYGKQTEFDEIQMKLYEETFKDSTIKEAVDVFHEEMKKNQKRDCVVSPTEYRTEREAYESFIEIVAHVEDWTQKAEKSAFNAWATWQKKPISFFLLRNVINTIKAEAQNLIKQREAQMGKYYYYAHSIK